MSETENVVNELATTIASIHEAYGNAANVTLCRKLAREFADKFKAAERAEALDVLQANDWSNIPQTISELRAEKTRKASTWSARDVCLVVLREIDAGRIKPELLVLTYAQSLENDDLVRYNWYLAHNNVGYARLATVGLLDTVLREISDE